MKDIICFDNADEKNLCFSNWYEAAFEIGGRRFTSVEQYMMYEKAELFGDRETARRDWRSPMRLRSRLWDVR